MKPSPFDVESVALSGTQLVEASAGTGKTYAISTLVVRLLLETERSIDEILVVTFTEAATAELKDRVRKRVKDALSIASRSRGKPAATDLERLVHRTSKDVAKRKLERALRDFDNSGIFTIHGFCQRALQENSFASGVPFNAELVRDARPLVEEIVLDFWAREVGPASKVFVEHLRDRGIDPERLRDLANRVSQTPLLEVVPRGLLERVERAREESGRSFGAIDAAPLRGAVERARQCFDEGEIETLLLGSGLNGNKYRRAYVPNWCRELTQMFEAGRALPRLPKQFDKFCTEALRDASRSTPPTHPFFDACDALKVEVERAEQVLKDERCLFYAALISTVQREFRAQKRKRGVLTFDDLLYGVYAALQGELGMELSRSLRERFPVALIDEFQDTDPLQYAIFKNVYVGKAYPLFLIGDPKQAIYSFRGADVFAYLDAANTVPEAQCFTMPKNYRSDTGLVSAVNELFSSAPYPFFLKELSFKRVDARDDAESPPRFPEALGAEPLQFRFIERPKGNAKSGLAGRNSGHELQLDKAFKTLTLPEQVGREVARTLAAGVHIDGAPLTPKHIAILTRTNAQAFDCQRALQRRSIPSVVLGDRSVFEYAEARELQLFLAAVLEPQNSRALRAALTTEMLGLTIKGLLELEGDEAEWDVWASRMRAYNQRWSSDGFVQMIRLALEECAISKTLLVLVDGERRMTNLLHLIELLHVAATTGHLGPSGLLHYLVEQRARVYDHQDSEQIRLESDEDAVKLTTIHKSKGLEYAVVICPYAFGDFLVLASERATPRFHALPVEDASTETPSSSRTASGSNRSLTLDVGSDELDAHLATMADEALAENLRLLYVALTRAKHRCVVFWGAVQGYEESALAYVLHSKAARTLLDEPNREQVAGYVQSLDDTALYARIAELARNPDIGVSIVDFDASAPQYRPAQESSETLKARNIDERLSRWQRTASFTELAQHTGETRLRGSDGRDHDEAIEPTKSCVTRDERCRLADFPGGARSGNFFHAVLEHCDFEKAPSLELVAKELRAHGLDPNLSSLAKGALWDVLRTRLATGPSLSELPRAARVSELEFHLSVGSFLLTKKNLAAVFRQHPSEELPRAYADDVERLHFMPLEGFLKGFIDLVFEHDGKWYIVDYKSNNLGEHYGDYEAGALSRCMRHSHYFLQYHLYGVALHRLLRLRKPDYAYERDFGGAFYLFLRGMRPGTSTGVFFEKPPEARIEALASLLAMNEREGSRAG